MQTISPEEKQRIQSLEDWQLKNFEGELAKLVEKLPNTPAKVAIWRYNKFRYEYARMLVMYRKFGPKMQMMSLDGVPTPIVSMVVFDAAYEREVSYMFTPKDEATNLQ